MVQESSAQLAMGEAFGVEAPSKKVLIPALLIDKLSNIM